jgi:hypothetical protein
MKKKDVGADAPAASRGGNGRLKIKNSPSRLDLDARLVPEGRASRARAIDPADSRLNMPQMVETLTRVACQRREFAPLGGRDLRRAIFDIS